MDIKTFIFFDSETTGLPCYENNDTRMTELCFVAIQSDHIGAASTRVQNKLTLCFNPKKTINPIAVEKTGLSNQLLECQLDFNDAVVNAIQSFFNLQRQPICLVAHNGNEFDFPILRAEINKAGEKIAEGILCVDSLLAFKAMHGKTFSVKQPSFKLATVYKRLTSKKAKNAHTSEGDVFMLIESAAALGQKFVDWCNQNAKKFYDVPMMQPGRKIGT